MPGQRPAALLGTTGTPRLPAAHIAAWQNDRREREPRDHAVLRNSSPGVSSPKWKSWTSHEKVIPHASAAYWPLA